MARVSSEVGAGHVAIFPVFKGMRSAVRKEVDASVKGAAGSAEKGFSDSGKKSGAALGKNLKSTLEASTKNLGTAALKTFEKDVSRTTAALSKARLSELDSIGRVRVAEKQLADARGRYSSESAQVAAAEERLATATRKLASAQDTTKSATDNLRAAQTKLADAADDAGDELERAGKRSAGRFSSGFKTIVGGAFVGVSLSNLATGALRNLGQAAATAFKTGFDFIVGSIDIASDLNESVNAVQVSYGDIAGQILAIGDTSAKTFGLSKNDLNSYAVQFSAFAKGIAGPGGDVVGTFSSILGRATDFASVMNLEVSDALALFQSGLAGETEPLRKYGIDLSAAAVEAYALRAGISDGTAELTEAQKQQARYGALLEQTSAVQGDFANTADELANKNRINAAEWENLQGKLGQGFLPIAQTLATVLGDRVLPIIDKLVTEQGPGLAKAFEDAIPSLTTMAEEILPKLPQLFEDVAKYLPIIIDGISTFGPGLLDLFGKFAIGAQQISDFFTVTGEKFTTGAEQWGAFFQGVATWWVDLMGRFQLGGEQIAGFFIGIGERFAEGGRQIGAFFADLGAKFSLGASQIGQFASAVSQKVGEVIQFFQDLPVRIGMILAGVGTLLFNSGKAIIQGFLDGISAMYGKVTSVVGGIVDFIGGFFPNSPAKRGPFSGAGWARLRTSGSAVVEQFQAGMNDASTTVTISGPIARLAAAQTTLTAAQAASGASRVVSSTSSGDTFHFDGVTTDTAAREIGDVIEKKKRRRVRRTGVLTTAGA